MHKSTAFRLLATLEAHRLVEQADDRGRYRLGVGNLRLAGATTARLDLVTEARPVCRQLAADTGETVNIAVRVRDLARSTSTRSPAPRPCSRTTGSASTSRCTRPATARCCSASSTDAELKAAVRELPRFTDQTITTRAGSATSWPQVREAGYAVAVDELEIGLTAAAAPIRNAHGDIIASMSISGPTFRLDAERLGRGGPACWSPPPPRSPTASAGASAPEPPDVRALLDGQTWCWVGEVPPPSASFTGRPVKPTPAADTSPGRHPPDTPRPISPCLWR